jgi:hypothetical protein
MRPDGRLHRNQRELPHVAVRLAGLLLGLVVLAAAADPAREALEVASGVAGSLASGDVGGFLRAFDPAMPGYAKLRENATALVGQGEVQSIVEPDESSGDASRRELSLDWTLRVERGVTAIGFAERKGTVKLTVEKRAGKWKIVAIDPPEFFAPLP